MSVHIDLPTILGTEKGISALAKFLEQSGAFTKTGEPPQGDAPRIEPPEAYEPDAPDDEDDDPDEVGEVEHSDEDEDAR